MINMVAWAFIAVLVIALAVWKSIKEEYRVRSHALCTDHAYQVHYARQISPGKRPTTKASHLPRECKSPELCRRM